MIELPSWQPTTLSDDFCTNGIAKLLITWKNAAATNRLEIYDDKWVRIGCVDYSSGTNATGYVPLELGRKVLIQGTPCTIESVIYQYNETNSELMKKLETMQTELEGLQTRQTGAICSVMLGLGLLKEIVSSDKR